MFNEKGSARTPGFTGHYYPSPDPIINPFFSPNTTVDFESLFASLRGYEPQTNVSETEEAMIFKILAPESAKENFDVEVKDGRLRVTQKIEKPTAFNKNFEKKFELKGVLRLGSATASYKEGVLTVEIPKLEPKQISVK